MKPVYILTSILLIVGVSLLGASIYVHLLLQQIRYDTCRSTGHGPGICALYVLER